MLSTSFHSLFPRIANNILFINKKGTLCRTSAKSKVGNEELSKPHSVFRSF